MKRKVISLVSVLGLTLSLILARCGQAEPPPVEKPPVEKPAEKPTIKIRYASFQPPNHPLYMSVEKQFKALEEKTKGRITVAMHPSGSLIGGKDMLAGIGTGTADIGHLYAPYMPSTLPIGTAHQIPFLFDDKYHYIRCVEDPAYTAFFNTTMTQFNVISADYKYCFSYDIMCSKKQIKVPSDLEGVSIKASGTAPIALIKKCGGTPVGMVYTEMYESVMRGLLDGGLTSTTASVTYKFWDIADYYTELALYPAEGGEIVNKDFYNSLSEEDRKLVMGALNASADYTIRTHLEKEEPDGEWGKALRDNYKSFYKATPEELAQWQEIAAPLQDEFRERLDDKNKALFDEYLKLVKKHRTK